MGGGKYTMLTLRSSRSSYINFRTNFKAKGVIRDKEDLHYDKGVNSQDIPILSAYTPNNSIKLR